MSIRTTIVFSAPLEITPPWPGLGIPRARRRLSLLGDLGCRRLLAGLCRLCRLARGLPRVGVRLRCLVAALGRSCLLGRLGLGRAIGVGGHLLLSLVGHLHQLRGRHGEPHRPEARSARSSRSRVTVRARARSCLTRPRRAVSSSSPVALEKRSPKRSRRSSATCLATSASSRPRSSLACIALRLFSPRAARTWISPGACARRGGSLLAPAAQRRPPARTSRGPA